MNNQLLRGNMAPSPVACRLLHFLIILFFILHILIQNSLSVLVYDRQTLLNLQDFTKDWIPRPQTSGLDSSTFLSSIPVYLQRRHGSVPQRNHRRRHLGKRGGNVVKSRMLWRALHQRQPFLLLLNEDSS